LRRAPFYMKGGKGGGGKTLFNVDPGKRTKTKKKKFYTLSKKKSNHEKKGADPLLSRKKEGKRENCDRETIDWGGGGGGKRFGERVAGGERNSFF